MEMEVETSRLLLDTESVQIKPKGQSWTSNRKLIVLLFNALPPLLYLFYIFRYTGGFQTAFPWSLHPMGMSLAVFLFLGTGVTSFKVLPWSHRARKNIHIVVNALVLVFLAGGLAAMFYYNTAHSFPHLYSFHSWLGIVVAGLVFCQFVIAFALFVWPVVKITASTRKQVMDLHRFLGYALYLTGSSLAAFQTGWLQEGKRNLIVVSEVCNVIAFVMMFVAVGNVSFLYFNKGSRK